MPRAGLDKSKVVAAAARIADSAGLQAVTLQAVAADLRIKSPSLYAHVDGLDALRRELSILGLEVLTQRLTDASIGRSGFDLLRSVASAQRSLANERPGLYAASVAANRPGDEELNEKWAGPVKIFRAVIRSYGIEGDEADHAMRVLRTSIHGFALVDSINGFRFGAKPDDTFERLVGSLHMALTNWSSVINAED